MVIRGICKPIWPMILLLGLVIHSCTTAGTGTSVVSTALTTVPAVSNSSMPKILAESELAPTPYLPDFSYAGYNNGIGDLPVSSGAIVDVVDHGAIANDELDDSKAVLRALAKAHETNGSVIVRFPAGKFIITERLNIERSNIVVQGAGSGSAGTTLYMPRPLAMADKSDSLDELCEYLIKLDKRQKQPAQNINEYFSEYSWTGGFFWVQKPGTRAAPYLESHDVLPTQLAKIVSGTRGTNAIQIEGANNSIRAGDVVQLLWYNQDGENAGIIKAIYGDFEGHIGSHHWTFKKRPLVRQTTKIVAVTGNAITIGDPLLHDINEDIPAVVGEWQHLTHVGIENIHIEFPNAPYFGHHLERGYNGIYMTSAFDSWVRNVRITNADSGILTYNSANLSLTSIVTDGDRRAHYAIHMGNVHNVLAEDLTIFNETAHALTFNTQSTKCVYTNVLATVSPVLDQHAGSNHQNLFDNVTLHVDATRDGNNIEATLFDGSGAGYWQPGHGEFNTAWNVKVLIKSGAYQGEEVALLATDEGPGARIIGLHGNRQFKLDYRPAPYIEMLNQRVQSIPSLYEHQKSQRLLAQQNQ